MTHQRNRNGWADAFRRAPFLVFVGLSLCVGCTRPAGPLRSKGELVEVNLPAGWEAATLPNNVSKIQAKCAGKNAFVVVISEAKEDFNYASLREYADAVLRLEEKKSSSQDRVVAGPKNVKLN